MGTDDPLLRPVKDGNTFEQTVERLAIAIRMGVVETGERLPPERDLAEQLNVSRVTLREAIKALNLAGYVTSTRGRTGGTVVTYDPKHRPTLDPHREARKLGAVNVLDALAFHGISQVEVKRDHRDGRDYLIEVNPRSWLWISLATRCGVNLPLACYLDAIGEPRQWPLGHTGRRRWILSGRHLPATARELARRRWSPVSAATSLRPPLVDGVWSIRDPRPGVSSYGRIIRRAVRR